MPRPVTTYEAVERGIQKVTRTYDDGRVVITFKIKYADAKHKIHSKTIQSHKIKDARDALAEARASVSEGKHVDAKDGRTLFLTVANQWFDVKESDWKHSTARNARWTIDTRLAPLHDVRMSDLDYDTVVRFRGTLSKTKDDGDRPAPASIKRTMQILSQICEYARKRRLIVENPCRDLDKIKQRKPALKMPTPEDVERLIARLSLTTPAREDSWGRKLKERPADPRWPLLVEVAAYTGLRAGELAGLQVRDLNVLGRSITVARTIVYVPGKGLHPDTPKSEAGTRTVTGIDAAVMKHLQALCDGRGKKDYVFGDRDEEGKPRPMHVANAYRRVIKPAAEALAIDMTFHGLRHHYASLLIDLGLSPVEVAAQLGHESAAFTLKTYAHLFKKDMTDVGDKIAERRAQARGEDTNVTPLRKKSKPF